MPDDGNRPHMLRILDKYPEKLLILQLHRYRRQVAKLVLDMIESGMSTREILSLARGAIIDVRRSLGGKLLAKAEEQEALKNE